MESTLYLFYFILFLGKENTARYITSLSQDRSGIVQLITVSLFLLPNHRMQLKALEGKKTKNKNKNKGKPLEQMMMIL